nr:retrovirus-related Pol polyprotein from transposon TNT 1-94 [Tanacetum cinerariifolium]
MTTLVLLVRRESSTKPLNKVLVTKPHNKTPYELLIGRAPIISFMRPFGCPVTILNTLDHLGKFNGKADEGFLVGYSINSKDFRVYNSITKKVEENCSVGNRTNGIAGSKIHYDAGQEGKEKVSAQEYILLPVLNTSSDVPSSNEEVVFSPKDDAGKKLTVKPTYVEGGKIDDLGCLDQQMKSTYDSENTNSTNSFNTASPDVNTASDKDGIFERTYGEWNFSTPITVNAAGYSFSHLACNAPLRKEDVIVNGRQSSTTGSNQQSNFIHATPSVNVYQTEYHATQIHQTQMPVFPGSSGPIYQNLPSYQQMHGFSENPVYAPGFFGLASKDESSESDEESSESDEEGSESDEDDETTSVENNNCKVDKFWSMSPCSKHQSLISRKK